MEERFVDIGLYVSYGMLFIAALGAIILPLISSISKPQSLIKGAVGIVFLGVLFLISWAISGNELPASYIQAGLDASGSKLVGGVLTMMYLLLGISIVGIIYTEISKAVK
jgi:hypothetical protein